MISPRFSLNELSPAVWTIKRFQVCVVFFLWLSVPEQTDTHKTKAEEKEARQHHSEWNLQPAQRPVPSRPSAQDGWLVTRLPARAELTLVDPFSCTEMEGTLQDRKQRQTVSQWKQGRRAEQEDKEFPLHRLKHFTKGTLGATLATETCLSTNCNHLITFI